ncbi:MAG: NAD-dependent epimerase/dehydratase family protein [Planctomycetota bacterium]
MEKDEVLDSFKGKNVLVTGGAGFVGSHFVEELLRQGASIRVTVHKRPLRIKDNRIETVKADLTQQEDCNRACRGVDYVVHAAGAVSAAGVTAGDNPMAAITTNLVLTSRILQAAWAEKVDRFLLFSSSTGYPDVDHPVEEEEFWSEPLHPSYFGYGWMRRYFERMGEYAHSRSNTKVAIVRPTAVYGRHDDFDPVTSHVIPALIKRALEKENPYVVWGSPDVVRDFLYVSDLVTGSLLVLEKHAECDPVNIGYGETVTIGEIVEMVLKAAGHENAAVEFDQSKPTTIPFRMVDTSKAKRILGYKPSLTVEEGIRDTVEWYSNLVQNSEDSE